MNKNDQASQTLIKMKISLMIDEIMFFKSGTSVSDSFKQNRHFSKLQVPLCKMRPVTKAPSFHSPSVRKSLGFVDYCSLGS